MANKIAERQGARIENHPSTHLSDCEEEYGHGGSSASGAVPSAPNPAPLGSTCLLVGFTLGGCVFFLAFTTPSPGVEVRRQAAADAAERRRLEAGGLNTYILL